MINPQNVPPVDGTELLARFITQRKQIRSDGTVKQDAFVAYSYVELSVTRHRDASLAEIQRIGEDVAKSRGRALYGRADIHADECRTKHLDVVPDPIPGNSNHANITGYPPAKEDQKAIAIELAANARFTPA